MSVNDVDTGQHATAWAVGEDIAFFDGHGWRRWPQRPPRTLRGISLTDAATGWAVGDSGTVLHLADRRWIESASGTKRDLHAVQSLSRTEAWAVGDGVLLHFDGQQWRQSRAGDVGDLRAVSFSSNSDGWVVGSRIMRFEGGDWVRYPKPVLGMLNDVAIVEGVSAEAWAVGDGGMILRFAGDAWREVPSPTTEDLMAVAFPSQNSGWAAGGNAVLQFDGARWSDTQLLPHPGLQLASLPSRSASLRQQDAPFDAQLSGIAWDRHDGWIVGRDSMFLRIAPGPEPPSLHQWEQTVNGVTVAGDGTIAWAVGSQPWFKYRSGVWDVVVGSRAWRLSMSGPTASFEWPENVDLRGVTTWDSDSAWVVGATGSDGGLIAKLDKEGVGEEHSLPAFTPAAAVAVGPDDLWVVGTDHSGANKHGVRLAGSDLQQILMPGSLGYNAIDFHGADSGWAVGPRGAVARLKDGCWEDVPDAPTSETLLAVAVVGVEDVWIGGMSGALWHLEGAEWTRSDAVNAHVLALSFSEPDAGWLVTNNMLDDVGHRGPQLMHYRDRVWHPVTESQFDERLRDVSASGSSVWIGGRFGLVARHALDACGPDGCSQYLPVVWNSG
jgi:hypothetical protein